MIIRLHRRKRGGKNKGENGKKEGGKKKEEEEEKEDSAKQGEREREKKEEEKRGTRPDSPGKQGVPLRVPMGEESSQAWRTTRNKACNRNIVVDRCILIM